ncbi:hypothetical protein EWM64_g3423 [Hericium alpestre]|uniref:Uncharacterized protein n=1 Tax=Hericium alpestre TaxID=135208 RepID=A0A4Z0A2Z5_9AGAM|nr:hypothetical protein EWM64_g3423 [Hericium alpestre]
MVKSAHDNIWFVLLAEQDITMFYLDLSIVVIQKFCPRPVKFLRYLAWCILGVVGPKTSILFNNAPVDDDDNLVKHGTYFFSAPEMSKVYQHIDILMLTSTPGNFERIFEEKPDFEHIPIRDESYDLFEPDKFEENEEDGFRDELLKRDSPCVFTNWDRGNSTRLIQEDHTPNCVLSPEDIPARPEHHVDPTDSYPDNQRYTFQWFEQNPAVMALAPNNSDAAFRRENQGALPSAHLLAFHYAVSVVKQWGRGWQEVLSTLKHNPKASGKYRATRSGISSAKAENAEGFHAADFLLLLCQYKPNCPPAQPQAFGGASSRLD